MADYKQLLQKLQNDLNELKQGELSDDSHELVQGMQQSIDGVLADNELPTDFTKRLRFLATKFEASHPSLTTFIDQVSSTLSNMGI